MDWYNDLHMLYRIILKLGGTIESIEDHKDNTYTIHITWPIRGYDTANFSIKEGDIPFEVHLTPVAKGDSKAFK